jgi:hypothetical protein
MTFSWLTWANPVSIWWVFLVSVSICNTALWIFTYKYISLKYPQRNFILYLSAGYVFGCAFRSVLTRADVQRLVLFDTWFSSVLVGRSVATVAELCFAAQWAIVLNQVAKASGSKWTARISRFIFPMIFIAEMFSWYGVITTHYLGNTIEESIWTLTYCAIAICLADLWFKFKGPLRYVIGISVVGCLLYVAFMVTVDVPMYWGRYQSDLQMGKELLSFSAGLKDLSTRWIVDSDIERWRTEIPWMSLYFSIAVWTSLGLCYIPTEKMNLLKHFKKP